MTKKIEKKIDTHDFSHDSTWQFMPLGRWTPQFIAELYEVHCHMKFIGDFGSFELQFTNLQ